MKTAISLFSSRIVGSVLQVLLLILLAREISVSDFGFFSAAFAISALICSFSDLGLSVLVPRSLISNRYDKLSKAINLHRTVLGIFLFASLCCFVSFSLVTELRSYLYLPVLLFAVSIEFYCETQLTIPIAKNLPNSVSLSIILRRSAPLFIFLTSSQFESIQPAFIAALSLLAGGLLGTIHVHRLNRKLLGPVKFRILNSRDLWRDIFRVIPNQILVSTRNLDVPLVGLIGGAGSAAAYSLGLRFSNPVALVASSVASVVLPRMVGAEMRHAKELFLRLVKYALYLSAFAAIVSPFIINPMVEALFGEKYGFAVPVVALMIISSPIVSITAPATSILLGLGRDKHATAIAAMYAATFVITVSLGVQLAGAQGAVVGSLLSASLRLFFTHRALLRG